MSSVLLWIGFLLLNARNHFGDVGGLFTSKIGEFLFAVADVTDGEDVLETIDLKMIVDDQPARLRIDLGFQRAIDEASIVHRRANAQKRQVGRDRLLRSFGDVRSLAFDVIHVLPIRYLDSIVENDFDAKFLEFLLHASVELLVVDVRTQQSLVAVYKRDFLRGKIRADLSSELNSNGPTADDQYLLSALNFPMKLTVEIDGSGVLGLGNFARKCIGTSRGNDQVVEPNGFGTAMNLYAFRRDRCHLCLNDTACNETTCSVC